MSDASTPSCGWCGEGCTHGPTCACGPCRERARTEARARMARTTAAELRADPARVEEWAQATCRWREEARLAWVGAVWALAALAGGR